MQVTHCIWGEKIQIIWAAGGLSLLVRSSSCGSAGEKQPWRRLPRHCLTAAWWASHVNFAAATRFNPPTCLCAWNGGCGRIEQGCPQGRKGMGPRGAGDFRSPRNAAGTNLLGRGTACGKPGHPPKTKNPETEDLSIEKRN